MYKRRSIKVQKSKNDSMALWRRCSRRASQKREERDVGSNNSRTTFFWWKKNTKKFVFAEERFLFGAVLGVLHFFEAKGSFTRYETTINLEFQGVLPSFAKIFDVHNSIVLRKYTKN